MQQQNRRPVLRLALSSCLVPAVGLGSANIAMAPAQDWPRKSIKVVVPYPPGGTADIMGRLVALKLGKAFPKISVYVENISGGATVPGTLNVMREAPDGHTLLLASDNTLNINHWLLKNPRYDGDKDFTPVTVLNTYPHWLVVNANGPYKTFDDLVKAMRAKPGKLSISVNTVGGSAYLALDSWRRENGLNFEIVPYRGSAPAVTDLIGGVIDGHADVVGSSIAHARSGRVKPVVIMRSQGVKEFPNAVTQDGNDPKSLFVQCNQSVVVRAGTPQAIVNKLYEILKTASTEEDYVKTIETLSIESVLTEPAKAKTFLLAETKRYGVLVEKSGLEKQ